MRTPPPRDDLRFSNTTGILQKKKRRVHPLLKKILDPLLIIVVPEKPLWRGNNKVCMYVNLYVCMLVITYYITNFILLTLDKYQIPGQLSGCRWL